jgi:hypothetical protein
LKIKEKDIDEQKEGGVKTAKIPRKIEGYARVERID